MDRIMNGNKTAARRAGVTALVTACITVVAYALATAAEYAPDRYHLCSSQSQASFILPCVRVTAARPPSGGPSGSPCSAARCSRRPWRPMPPPRPRLPPARGHHGPPLHVSPRRPPPPRRQPRISLRQDLPRVHLLLRSERRRQLRALSPWRGDN
ncbi:hypothetical protein ACQJBY_055766 [Aegilops geniculata]